MKRYAEFYQRGVMTNNVIPACGSDSIVYLDARQSDYNQRSYAAKVAKQRGFIGYRIMAYPILPERAISQVILLAA